MKKPPIKKRKSATAKPVNLLTEPLPIKRIQGSRSRFAGIDAVVDPHTGEILRTYTRIPIARSHVAAKLIPCATLT